MKVKPNVIKAEKRVRTARIRAQKARHNLSMANRAYERAIKSWVKINPLFKDKIIN